MKLIYVNRIAAHSGIFQKSETDPIDIEIHYCKWVYPIDMLKKYRLLMSRYFCVQSSSMMSASRPIMVSAPRMTFPAFTFSPPSTIRKVFNRLDDEIDHRADGLKDWAECNHANRLPSINMRITIRRSSHGAKSDRTAFPRFPPPNSRSRATHEFHLPLCRTPSPR